MNYSNFLKDFFADLFADFSSNSNNTSSTYWKIVAYDTTTGEKIIRTSEDQKKSPKQIELEKEILEKKLAIKKLVDGLNFEDAIPIRDKLKELQDELNSEIGKIVDEREKNKTSKQMLKDLSLQLDAAVASEDYEKASEIRDEIKKLKDAVTATS